MRKFLLLIIVFFLIEKANCQETAIDKVSKNLCEYFTQDIEEFNKMSHEQKLSKLGVKLIESYIEFKDDFEKEGIVFDLSKGAEEGERLGELIGLNMARFCPDFILSLAGNEALLDTKEASSSVKGKIKKIVGEDLTVLSIKDSQGKTQKFIWLTNFEGSDKLIDLNDKAKGKEVEVFFENFEIFSPKMKEYILRKKITKIEFLD